jgi:hypothetical protein
MRMAFRSTRVGIVSERMQVWSVARRALILGLSIARMACLLPFQLKLNGRPRIFVQTNRPDRSLTCSRIFGSASSDRTAPSKVMQLVRYASQLYSRDLTGCDT